MEKIDRVSVNIRRATEADASIVCEVLIRSIREICGKDYDNDALILDEWCRNKTPEEVASWIREPLNYFIVAELPGSSIVGAAKLRTDTASILLCYVLPEVLHCGVGALLLSFMEKEAQSCGLKQLSLASTKTAKSFYERKGYCITGDPVYWGKVVGYPMVKVLKEEVQRSSPADRLGGRRLA